MAEEVVVGVAVPCTAFNFQMIHQTARIHEPGFHQRRTSPVCGRARRRALICGLPPPLKKKKKRRTNYGERAPARPRKRGEPRLRERPPTLVVLVISFKWLRGARLLALISGWSFFLAPRPNRMWNEMNENASRHKRSQPIAEKNYCAFRPLS